MNWDHLFDDLETQLAAEWEAERAALDAESERLRISKIPLVDRLRRLRDDRTQLTLELGSGERLDTRLEEVGADWIAIALSADPRTALVPLTSIVGLTVDHGSMLTSLEHREERSSVRGRMTFGFVLRDLARRRVRVLVSPLQGDPLHGTIDRAGADHLDLAVHDPDEPRRARSVRSHRMLPFAAIAWIRPQAADSSML